MLFHRFNADINVCSTLPHRRRYNFAVQIVTSCVSRASRVAIVIATFIFLLAPPAHSRTPADYLHSLLNHKLILLHVGDQEKVKVKKDHLSKLPSFYLY